MRSHARNPILLGLLSAILLDLPFPIAGPMSPWRAIFAWIALVPLLYGLLAQSNVEAPRYLRRSALVGYACGILWYALNSYWIYDTMYQYGHVPPPGAVGILILYSLVLGLYFGLFGFLIALSRKAFRTNIAPLLLAPFFWAAIEFAASRITSVPWDQLGYSQVDNFLLTHLAPVTGVYGISFVLIAGNALFAAALLARSLHLRLRIGVGACLFAILLQLGSFTPPKPSAASAYAVMLQPNLDVGVENIWLGPEWDENVSWIMEQSQRTCTPAYAGMPTADAKLLTPECSKNVPPPGLIAWPEAPSSFISDDPRTIAMMRTVATTAHAPMIVGMFGHDATGTYNSGVVTAPDGSSLGRYDKIHLVPFGEYIPYRNVFFFAHKLTQQIVDLQRGKDRLFARNGAQVFVNISDDGWYGDTSAPWQHLNMARMRAIENRRWIVRDTNNGVTTSIDPYGRVTLSAPRHMQTSLVARYGYNDELTFYTRFGDLFAMLCGIITLAVAGNAMRLVASQSSPKRQVS